MAIRRREAASSGRERVRGLVPMRADGHLDLPLVVRGAHRAGRRDDLRRRWAPRLRAGGLALQVLAVWTDDRAPATDALRTVLESVEAVLSEAGGGRDELLLVRERDDLDEAGLKLVLALEGADALGDDLSVLRVLHRLGLRMLGLTYNAANALGAGCDGEGGLTPLGVEVVRACEALGIVVDLAHAADATLEDAVAVARRPVVISHTACRALHPLPRNASDAAMRAVVATGGVVGIALHPSLLGPPASIDRAVEHVRHAVDVAGPEHVALGSDFCAPLAEVLSGHDEELFASVSGLAGPEDLPALEAALGAGGLGATERAGIMGENLVRVLRATLPG